MEQKTISFLGKYAIFVFATGLLFFCFYFFIFPSFYYSWFPITFFFFVFLYGLSYFLLQRSLKRKQVVFVNTFMILSVSKLLLLAVLMALTVFSKHVDPVQFLLSVLFLYFFFTVFEIITINKEIKR